MEYGIPTQHAIEGYKQTKWNFFPLIVGGKTPAFKGWQEWAEKCTLESMQGWADNNPNSNWGIYCGASNLCVIDVDAKTGKQGKESIAPLLGSLPKTFQVNTPKDSNGNGGYHLYYRGAAPSTTSALGKDIDTRGIGGYVVAPGSFLAERNSFYQIEDPSVKVTATPSWVSTTLVEAKKEVLKRPADDQVENSIAEGERNTELVRWAGVLRGQGLTIPEMEMALLGINITRCVNPLPEDDLISIANSIGSKPTNEMQVQIRKEKAFGAVMDESSAAGEDRPLPLRELPRVSLEERNSNCWIIKDVLLRHHVISLYGDGGVGKSLLAIQLGLSIASGTPFCGLDIDMQMPVIYLGCEDEEIETNFRLTQIRDAPEIAQNIAHRHDIPFYSWIRDGLDSVLALQGVGGDLSVGPFMQLLEDRLAKLPSGDKLLILDNVSDIFLGNENIRTEVNRFIKFILGDLRKKYNLTILLLAHPSRSGAEDSISGSTAWQSAVRSRLAFVKDDDEIAEHRILKVLKSNRGPQDLEYPMLWQDWRYLKRERISEVGQRLIILESAIDKLKSLGEISINDLAEHIIGSPVHASYFKDVTSQRRQREQVLRDVRVGITTESWRSNYELRSGKVKHWLVIEPIKKEGEWK